MGQAQASGSAGHAASTRLVAQEGVAGLVASVVLIGNIVSFAALMFPGPLASGASTAMWSMLVGGAVAGLWVSAKTSLPPMAIGIDSPTGAVLVLVASSASHRVLAAGGSPNDAITASMLLFTLATVLTGTILLALGTARWGSSLRFVPYFVVAGFLGATGWLLVDGAVRMSTGHHLVGLLHEWTATEAERLACAVAVWAVLMALRRWVRWPLALPVALVLMTLLGSLLPRLAGTTASVRSWYLPSLGALEPWHPLQALSSHTFPAGTLLASVPELFAVAIVALVSLVTKVSSMEVTRKASMNLDVELRAHGLGSLLAAPLGGITSSMQLGTSRMLENTGGATRLSGMVGAAVLGVVALLGFDLPALIPLPIAAGLVLQLGWNFLADGLAKMVTRRDWPNLALALAIMVACVRFGYLAGVLGGVVGACILFALSYARVGTVRQHLSRAQFAGNVSRSPQALAFLSNEGEGIQVYWLAGYLFFGSSESFFETVQRDVRALRPRRVSHVIVDFMMVSAADASATVSLAKLANFCRKEGIRLMFSGPGAGIRRMLDRDGLTRGSGALPVFPEVTAALAWSEDALLAQAGLDANAGDAAFRGWLRQQLGSPALAATFCDYVEARSFGDGEVLYRQGEPADAIDLVVSGHLVVEVESAAGPALRLRSITTQSVVGEMGFFGHVARSATVRAEGSVSVMTLTREAFARLRREQPEAAGAFYEFLLRTLADRIRTSDRMSMALGGPRR